jgi:hypothetical protein
MVRAWCTLLLLSATASAGKTANTCDGPKNVEPITERAACVGFVAHDAAGKEVSRVAKGYWVSGRILASADGRSVAMIHDAPTTTHELDSNDALIFFRDGKEVAKYSMRDLIVRMSLITRSGSRLQWLIGLPAFELGKTLTLTTTSQRKYVFDVATGRELSSGDTPQWQACNVIAYVAGTIGRPSGGYYSTPKPRVAKGGMEFSSGMTFRIEKDKPAVEGRSGLTLCLMPSMRGWVATDIIDVIYNVDDAPAN